MADRQLQIPISLDAFRPLVEQTAEETGVVLDFLMRTWNGRFATYNVGRPVAHGGDHRRGIRGEPRQYRLIGRVKANSRAGQLSLALTPPASCDPAPAEEDLRLWDHFVEKLLGRLERAT